jgi:hypothetical protein
MNVYGIEPLSEVSFMNLVRHAKFERRKRSEGLLNMRLRDVINAFWVDISELSARRSSGNDEHETPLPPLGREDVGPFEDVAAIQILIFAQETGAERVLVQFDYEPSKRFVDRFRQSARARNVCIRFFRLIDNYAAVEVHPKTNDFLS